MPKDTVKKRIEAGAIIIDVRSHAEFAAGAYPGAVNIPLQDLGRRVPEIRNDRPVVLYCASGFRSASAAIFLKKAGFTDVVNAGGLADMPR
jgi:phage shock protein E